MKEVNERMAKEQHMTTQGEASYQAWREGLRANPEYQAIYEEEGAKSALWDRLAKGKILYAKAVASIGATSSVQESVILGYTLNGQPGR